MKLDISKKTSQQVLLDKKTCEMKTQLDKSWYSFLQEEFQKDYMSNLRTFIKEELEKGKTIYPHGKNIFTSLNSTPFNQVKCVILGQDPYHGPHQAHGLCFSVERGVRTPPSLVNIYKEIFSDLGISPPEHGNLIYWAKQGVLLLNNVLTVEANKANSHRGKGWEIFTDKIVELLNQYQKNLVFLLWGSAAQEKGKNIDLNKHLVLKSPHPSPLSAYRGFLGNQHFSKCNKYLEENGINPIDWAVS